MPVLDRLLSVFLWPSAQHPWVQLCNLTLSQALALGPGTDPLRCSKAVANLTVYSSGCLESPALTLRGVLGKDISLVGTYFPFLTVA